MKLAVYNFATTESHAGSSGGWPANGNDYFNELKQNEIALGYYQQVDIAIASHKLSLAPKQFIEGEYLRDVMNVAQQDAVTDEIFTEPVFDLGPVICAVIPTYIRKTLLEIFPAAVLHLAPAVFVKGILKNYSQLIERQVFLNLLNGFLEIAVIQGSRLLYLNSFRFSAVSDVLYYVIFVLEQLGFVPSEENVTILGDLSKDDLIYSQLKMYCASLSLVARPEGIAYGEEFSAIEMFRYFILLNIPKCE